MVYPPPRRLISDRGGGHNRMTILPYILVLIALSASEGEAIIGINWGRRSAQRLVPSQVVDLLLQNGIQHARVYSLEEDMLQAFSGSGINLTVTILNATAITSIDDAKTLVQINYQYFRPCNIRAVFLGGYVFGEGNIGNKAFIHAAMNSLQFLQRALNEFGFDDIKVTFLHYIAALKANTTRPSEADFVDEVTEDMTLTLRILQSNDAPFVIELFPILDTKWINADPSYAMPDNKSPLVVTDVNGAVYRNLFEYTYDSFAWALSKHNASDLKIVVSQVGWPTDGVDGATAQNAERFFKHLLPFVASNKGTPMRPGAPIDTFVHALTDENRQNFTFSRHWGIYRSNGEPKYKIDLSGQGRDIFPVTIKGIMRMPERWCVYNGDRSDMGKVGRNLDMACRDGDCTSIAVGASCGLLNHAKRVSYAFNMYFQFQFQDERACDFDGLAYVTVENPSTPDCVFPIEVVKGEQINYGDPVAGKRWPWEA